VKRRDLPEFAQKAFIVGGLAGALGAGTGFLVGRGSLLAILVGVGVGTLLGYAIAILFRGALPVKSLERIESRSDAVLGVLSVLLCLAGIVGFYMTGRWGVLLSGGLFGAAAVYLFSRARET
jgi:hypothetical protein